MREGERGREKGERGEKGEKGEGEGRKGPACTPSHTTINDWLITIKSYQIKLSCYSVV